MQVKMELNLWKGYPSSEGKWKKWISILKRLRMGYLLLAWLIKREAILQVRTLNEQFFAYFAGCRMEFEI